MEMQNSPTKDGQKVLDTASDQLDPFSSSLPKGSRMSTEEGIITLTGFLADPQDRLTATEVARSVPGVRVIVDHINLDSALLLTDRAVAQNIVHALTMHGYFPDGNIAATVRDGMVLLDGSVPWNCQRRAVGACVRGIAGVQGICNRLELPSEQKARVNSSGPLRPPQEETSPSPWERTGAAERAVNRIAVGSPS
jgi:BON domain